MSKIVSRFAFAAAMEHTVNLWLKEILEQDSAKSLFCNYAKQLTQNLRRFLWH